MLVVNERHYINPVATASAFKGTGLGRVVVGDTVTLPSADRIDEVGQSSLTGTPSERLFTSLGFIRYGPGAERARRR